MKIALNNELTKRLELLYPKRDNSDIINFIINKIRKTKLLFDKKTNTKRWSEKDTVLITYGNSILSDNCSPLKTLNSFLNDYLSDTFSTIHILPFFPYSSDDGFSIIDYKNVNPKLGNWEDIQNISQKYRLMADLVINHASSKSQWFKDFLENKNNYFFEAEKNINLTNIIRARSHPLLTPFKSKSGTRYLWTTFSADQIDLNFKSPELFIEMVDILFFYIEMGITTIRLDAIACLWKEVDTNCFHLPQTHEVVKIFRTIFNNISKELLLLTETNVPNKDNLSYFGDDDETHMVYQFALPPLLLYTLYSGNSKYLNDWIKALPTLTKNQTFFNFTASHDGIGIRPLQGVLPKKNINSLINGMKKNGALLSTIKNGDGTVDPYEMNITYFDACKASINSDKYHKERFLCSQTIVLSLQGIPALYIQSLFGCPNDIELYNQTKRHRSVNRKSWNISEVNTLLHSENIHNEIFNEIKRRVEIRNNTHLFSPKVSQKNIYLEDNFFILRRDDKKSNLFAIYNITDSEILLDTTKLITDKKVFKDLLSTKTINITAPLKLLPYECYWLLSTDK